MTAKLVLIGGSVGPAGLTEVGVQEPAAPWCAVFRRQYVLPTDVDRGGGWPVPDPQPAMAPGQMDEETER
jgi:hypothetical protein